MVRNGFALAASISSPINGSLSLITPDEISDADGVARHYNELDQFYREVWGEHVHHGYWETGRESPEQAVEKLIDVLLGKLTLPADADVCDIGCGYGATSRYLRKKYQFRVTGVTVSQAQWDYATDQSADSEWPKFLLQNWLENELESDAYDLAVSIECFSHIVDKQRYFDEIARVLKPGGQAAIAVWLANPKASSWAVRHLLKPICQEGRLPSMATTPECEEMIARAGLQLVSFEDASRRVSKTWSICAWRLASKIATRRKYLWTLLDASTQNRIFALTLFRIMYAYWTGAMQYGLFAIRKPLPDDFD